MQFSDHNFALNNIGRPITKVTLECILNKHKHLLNKFVWFALEKRFEVMKNKIQNLIKRVFWQILDQSAAKFLSHQKEHGKIGE